jgi:hypothetical protein
VYGLRRVGIRGTRIGRVRLALSLLAGATGALAVPPVASAATLTVTTTDFQSASACTLSDAITAANLNQDWGACVGTGPYGTDAISVTATGTMTLPNSSFGLPSIGSHLSIAGPGPDQLEIRREDGPNAFRVLIVNPGASATVSGLKLSKGRVTQIGSGGAGILSFGTLTLDRVEVVDNHVVIQSATENPATPGAGIANAGTGELTLRRSTVAGNTVSNSQTATTGSRSVGADGAGIWSIGPLTVERSTVANNTATASVASSDQNISASARGAGIYADGATNISLSTVTGNRAAGTAPNSPNAVTNGRAFSRGAGLHSQGQVTITSSTIASNGSDAGSTTLVSGANVWAEGTETATNTIIAYPVGGSNCDFGFEADGGGNLVFPAAVAPSPPTCGLGAPVTADPLLGPLADNAGPTQTRAIPLNSPAVDAGVDSGESTDQRESGRPVDRPEVPNSGQSPSPYDIGAFEVEFDTDPPETTIDSFRVNARRRKARFTFSSSEPGSTFECSLDNAPFEPCSSPATARGLDKGRHRFEVRAFDLSGNRDPSQAVQRFRINP